MHDPSRAQADLPLLSLPMGAVLLANGLKLAGAASLAAAFNPLIPRLPAEHP